MSFNLWNYFLVKGRTSPVKKEESKTALVKVIKAVNPDIIMISEIGGKSALDDFMKHLKKNGLKYIFGTVMYGADRTRYIGCVSKYSPEHVYKKYDFSYKIKSKKSGELEKVFVQRGFLHVIFDIKGYKFNIIHGRSEEHTSELQSH